MAEDSPHITMQHISKFLYSLDVCVCVCGWVGVYTDAIPQCSVVLILLASLAVK